jgi:beta-lactamase regulating signal transducer with metallopeptidase domain
MNTSFELLAESLGWTLLHFCWQAAAIALAYWVADRFIDPGLPRARSQGRYLVSLAAMLSMLAASLATLGYEIERNKIENSSGSAVSSSVAQLPVFGVLPASATSDAASNLRNDIDNDTGDGEDQPSYAPLNQISPQRTRVDLDRPAPLSISVFLIHYTSAFYTRAALHLHAVLPWLDVAWLLGVLGLSARTFGGWWWIQRLRRRAFTEAPAAVLASFSRVRERLGIRRRVDLRISGGIPGPMALGVLRSLILLPASALLALSTEQMEVVLAHELAHVRRADYFWNLVQTMIETLFFFHPAVWWLGGRLREQRELCCDDVAVDFCTDPLLYATALLSMEEQRERRLNLAMALDGQQSRSGLRARIERMLGEASPRESGRGLAPLPLAALCVGLAILLIPTAQVFGSFGGSLGGSFGGSLGGGLAGGTQRDQTQGQAQNQPPAQNQDESQNQAQAPKQTLAQAGAPRQPVLAPAAPDAPVLAPDSSSAVPIAPQAPPQVASPSTGATERNGMADHPPAKPEQRSTPEPAAPDAAAVNPQPRPHAVPMPPEILISPRDVGPIILPDLSRLSLIDPQIAAQLNTQLKQLQAMHVQLFAAAQQKLNAHIQAKLAENLSKLEIAKDIGPLAVQGDLPQADSDYIDKMRAAGYDLPAERYTQLKIMGITPEYAQEMQKLGLGKPSSEDLIAMKMQGVTPQYVEKLHAAGIEPHSFHEIITDRIFHISPEYLAAMKTAGFASLSPQELIALRSQGVTPEYAADMKKQFPNVTMGELMQLRIFRIDDAFIAEAKRHNFNPLTVRTLVRLRISGLLNDSASVSDKK